MQGVKGDGRRLIHCCVCGRTMGRSGTSQCAECRELRRRLKSEERYERSMATEERIAALRARAEAGLPLFP